MKGFSSQHSLDPPSIRAILNVWGELEHQWRQSESIQTQHRFHPQLKPFTIHRGHSVRGRHTANNATVNHARHTSGGGAYTFCRAFNRSNTRPVQDEPSKKIVNISQSIFFVPFVPSYIIVLVFTTFRDRYTTLKHQFGFQVHFKTWYWPPANNDTDECANLLARSLLLNVTALLDLYANGAGLQFTETKQSSRVTRDEARLKSCVKLRKLKRPAHTSWRFFEGGGREPLIIYDSRCSSKRSCAPVSPWHLICLKISECAVWSWRVDVRDFSSSSTPEPQEIQLMCDCTNTNSNIKAISIRDFLKDHQSSMTKRAPIEHKLKIICLPEVND